MVLDTGRKNDGIERRDGLDDLIDSCGELFQVGDVHLEESG